jgi:hypothetical protein
LRGWGAAQLFNLGHLQSIHCYDASNIWTEVTWNPEITLQLKHDRLGDRRDQLVM